MIGRLRAVDIRDDQGDPMPLRAIWYNNLGWKDSTWNPDQSIVRILYDRGGRPRFIRDDRGMDDSTFVYYKYDQFGRKIEEGIMRIDTLPGTGTPIFSQQFVDLPDFPIAAWNENLRHVAYRWSYDYDFNVDSSVNYGKVVRVWDRPEYYVREFH